ncbi:GntR family transcriptional regulator [Streptomyces cocklensis]|uniref:Transcriptional regulator, GntR family n=1 Tax=Actinacidiphila cocklensis TaxID=887465 RepID=A0A9W4GXP9_9ACTN|nr:GntR family transcriptional regulator [Actinacidiphila cocklensis]MDD1058850.1 GntR family transcriptional regulator [Actinacidiphila cocklensis]WSX74951.1 GntR family transcriptional regulator [Streptomyces sp. NBC_00899]CAG6398980.1 Transcriptional regulator, GntR family [Actinacidiphila cocklensis]
MPDTLAHSGGPHPGVPPSRSEAVLDSLKHAILTGELKPGQALVEADLAERLHVSKTPVREALKTLAASGLVTTSAYKGAAVREVDQAHARCVYDMRLLLEPAAAARSATSERIGQDAREALERADRAADTAERSLANRAFHRALYSGCGNPLLVKSLDDLRDQTALLSSAAWSRQPSWELEAAEHRAILQAAEAGDAELVRDLMHRHIASFVARNFPEDEA